jgi:hypothetical protein
MSTIARVIAVIAALLLAVGAAVFLFLRSPVSSDGLYRMATAVGLDAAPPERHVVPEDFQGWVVVHFAVEGARPLAKEDGALIIEYPATGRLDTSTPAPESGGLIQRGYYRRTPDGLVPLSRAGDIWGEFTHLTFPDDGSQAAGRSSGFFVGTMAAFRATEWPVEHRRPVATEE